MEFTLLVCLELGELTFDFIVLNKNEAICISFVSLDKRRVGLLVVRSDNDFLAHEQKQ